MCFSTVGKRSRHGNSQKKKKKDMTTSIPKTTRKRHGRLHAEVGNVHLRRKGSDLKPQKVVV